MCSRAAGGVPVSGAVFRVRRVGDIALLIVQWALVLLGLYLILVALHLYYLDCGWSAAEPAIKPVGDTYYIRPSWHRLVDEMTTAFVVLGQAALLFYLRRIFLARHK